MKISSLLISSLALLGHVFAHPTSNNLMSIRAYKPEWDDSLIKLVCPNKDYSSYSSRTFFVMQTIISYHKEALLSSLPVTPDFRNNYPGLPYLLYQIEKTLGYTDYLLLSPNMNVVGATTYLAEGRYEKCDFTYRVPEQEYADSSARQDYRGITQ